MWATTLFYTVEVLLSWAPYCGAICHGNHILRNHLFGSRVSTTSTRVQPWLDHTFQSRKVWIRNIRNEEPRCKRNTETWHRTGSTIQWVLHKPMFIFHMLIYPSLKGGRRQKTSLKWHNEKKKTITCFDTRNIKPLNPELNILLIRQNMQQLYIRPSIL